MKETVVLAIDATRQKVGCVLLQAALGGNEGIVKAAFPEETWLTAPTDELRLYRVPQAMVDVLASRFIKALP